MSAKFNKKGEVIVISNLSERELHAIFKIDVLCKLVFTTVATQEVIDEVTLGERQDNIGNAQVQIHYMSTISDVTYDKVIEIINTNTNLGSLLTVEINKKDFQSVEPLLLMLGTIKQEIVNSCQSIAYDLKNKFFSILYLRKKGFKQKMFYFEDNDSILAFTLDGPQLLIGKTSSIEDLLCD